MAAPGLKIPWEVGDEIRKARTSAGLDQTQLGAALGVSRNTISSWERGAGGEPTISQWRRIASVTNALWMLSSGGEVGGKRAA